MIEIKIDTKKCSNYLATIVKQIPFAASQALNNVAFAVKDDEVTALSKHLDRPTPFTQRAYEVIKANKARLIATVRARQVQGQYLQWQVDGGTRGPKSRAIVLPRDIKLNAYGNMTKGAVKTALKRKDVFSGSPGNRPGGIWQRIKARGKGNTGSLKLLVAYTSSASYDKRLPFHEVARATVAQRFRPEFQAALARAIASAK